MPDDPPSSPRTALATKARIMRVAQDLFAAKGYSHAGLREIAAIAEVAPSLVIKHFGSKSGLFEQALVSALLPLQQFQQDRTAMGETIVAALLDPASRMVAPAMIALALGDPESRSIAERVVTERIVEPMAAWLETGDARERALNILAMTTGFAVFQRNFAHDLGEAESDVCGRLFARSIQDIVDGA